MPVPIVPSEVKAMIPQTSGSFCERFKKLFNFPRAFHTFLSYAVKEDGGLTDEFQADLCALPCAIGDGGSGENPTNPFMPSPASISASDGTYSDKITITWPAVTPPEGTSAVTFYRLYRSLSDNTDPNEATLIASVAAPTLTYDDETAVEGTYYNFWVTALNGTETSAFRGPDIGNADEPTTTLDAISDLRATVGFGYGYIALVWTPPAGATHYDVYRGTTVDFEDAELLYEDVVPYPTTSLADLTAPTCYDNVEEIVLYDTPVTGPPVEVPIPDEDFFFFVVAKKNSPPAVSPESNVALGRINPPAIYNLSTMTLQFGDDDEYTVEAGITKMWAVLFPSGGGGAGAGTVYGGGGGGGAGVVMEEFDVAEGDVVTLVHTPSQDYTTNAAVATNGEDGALTELQINAVTKLSCDPGLGGVYSGAGGGAGGAVGVATGDVDPTIYAGHAGMPGAGSSGGRSGYFFSGRRLPMYDWHVYPETGSGKVGSGAMADPTNGGIATGSRAQSGTAFLAFGS